MSRTRIPLLILLALSLMVPAAYAQSDPEPQPTPTVGPAPPASHVVQEGETLYSIAAQYGTSVEQLQQLNQIADPALIYVGQTLRLPGQEPAMLAYTVQLGDSLPALAQAFHTTPETLARRNGLLNPAQLVAGQTIEIPQPDAATPPETMIGRPYVVRPGETMLEVAARVGLSPARLAAMNSLPYPTRLYPGQRLRLPGESPFQQLPGEWATVRLGPLPAAQGHTLSLYLENLLPGEPTGKFAGQTLHFAPQGAGYVALIGLDAFTQPGAYALQLAGGGSRPWTPFSQWVQVQPLDYGSQALTLPEDKSGLLDPALVNAELALLAEVYGTYSPQQRWQGLFTMPVTGTLPVTSGYGIARSYNGGPYSSFHSGIDFAGPAGTAVLAPNAGIVILSRPLQVRGNVVIIDHGLGVMTGYYHLNRLTVKEGDFVATGDQIGEIGTTGLSTGAHLHWDLRLLNVPVDARQWLETTFP